MNNKILEEKLAKPLEEVMFHLGRGIALTQMELDKNSMAIQVMIDNNPDLKKLGLESTWYQIPEVDIDLKIAVHIVEEKEESIKRKRIFVSPINATYKNEFNYDVSASTSIKMKIVPIPPPIKMGGK